MKSYRVKEGAKACISRALFAENWSQWLLTSSTVKFANLKYVSRYLPEYLYWFIEESFSWINFQKKLDPHLETK